jgi:hypothetical protein
MCATPHSANGDHHSCPVPTLQRDLGDLSIRRAPMRTIVCGARNGSLCTIAPTRSRLGGRRSFARNISSRCSGIGCRGAIRRGAPSLARREQESGNDLTPGASRPLHLRPMGHARTFDTREFAGQAAIRRNLRLNRLKPRMRCHLSSLWNGRGADVSPICQITPNRWRDGCFAATTPGSCMRLGASTRASGREWPFRWRRVNFTWLVARQDISNHNRAILERTTAGPESGRRRSAIPEDIFELHWV